MNCLAKFHFHFKRARWIFVLSLTMIFLISCQVGPENPPPTPIQPVEIEVDEPVSASGEVIPKQWSTVNFTASGKLEQILAAEGKWVTTGEILARLDDEERQLAYTQANAALRRAEAALRELQAQPRADALAAARAALANAEANYDRLDRANASEIELEAAQAQITSARTALEKLEKGVSQDQIRAAASEVQTALLNLEHSRRALDEVAIRAPFSGKVIEIYPKEGDLVTPGTPLLLLADLQNLQVATTDLSELDVVRIQIGDPVEVSFDALPGVSTNGRVAKIADQASPGSNVTYRVVVDLDTIPAELRWGMTAFITFQK